MYTWYNYLYMLLNVIKENSFEKILTVIIIVLFILDKKGQLE